jgi:hypothetical protein
VSSYAGANTFDSANGWGVSTIISQGSGDISYPHLAVDSSGNATAVWLQRTSPNASLMVALDKDDPIFHSTFRRNKS